MTTPESISGADAILALLTNPVSIGVCVAVAAIAIVLLATAAAPFIAVISQRLGVSRKKSFYDKFAKQLATMATTLGGVFFAGLAAGGVQLAMQQPELFQGPFRMPIIICLSGVLFAFALLLFYTMVWKALRKSKGLHQLIGALASLSMVSMTFLSFGLLRGLLQKGHPLAGSEGAVKQFLTLYTIPATDMFWPMFVQALLGGVGAAGMLGCCYLLLRRNADDFGRDYYKFTLPFCARWALVPTLLQLVPAAYILMLLKENIGVLAPQNPALWCVAALFALPLLACVCWLTVVRSENPLRCKPAILLTLPLTILGLAAQGLLIMHFAGLM